MTPLLPGLVVVLWQWWLRTGNGENMWVAVAITTFVVLLPSPARQSVDFWRSRRRTKNLPVSHRHRCIAWSVLWWLPRRTIFVVASDAWIRRFGKIATTNIAVCRCFYHAANRSFFWCWQGWKLFVAAFHACDQSRERWHKRCLLLLLPFCR